MQAVASPFAELPTKKSIVDLANTTTLIDRHCWLAGIAFFVWVGLSTDSSEAWTVSAEPWPEADVLFRRDTRWRGSDAANSIDLGGGRVLWTFGDTFVDDQQKPSERRREGSTFVRNTIAIQKGYDPTTADFEPFWGSDTDGKPVAFFQSKTDDFYWPGGGLLVDDKLLIFLMRIRNADVGLKFIAVGWSAVLIENPQDSPAAWNIKYLSGPPNGSCMLVGSGSSVRVGNWIYTYGSKCHPPHKVYLARFRAAAAVSGDLSQPQWWNASDARWVDQNQLQGTLPEPIVDPGAPEFTIHQESTLGSYLLTQFDQFPVGPILLRSSATPTGPWSAAQAVYAPEEPNSYDKGIMTYSAKAHPEQHAAGLAVTYCTNHRDSATLIRDETLYYPRFIRVKITGQESQEAEEAR